ncbi:FISUMP domain-containing protein [Dyadobacter sp. SG02]|uniref:FISUMP domain-containing protein n=1 Tax=Dyadobacter sp. SG02 TaxID=1855291 RepID=UPI0038D40F01
MNRKEFGLLYTWESAKKACPIGWHLPTDTEWATLVGQFGGLEGLHSYLFQRLCVHNQPYGSASMLFLSNEIYFLVISPLPVHCA